MDYQDMTVKELRQRLRDRNIAGRSKFTTKQQMIEELEKRDERDRLSADESVENFTGTPPNPIAPPTFPEPEPEDETDYLQERIEQRISQMSLRERENLRRDLNQAFYNEDFCIDAHEASTDIGFVLNLNEYILRPTRCSCRDRINYLMDLSNHPVEDFTGTPPKPIAPPTFPEPEPEPDGLELPKFRFYLSFVDSGRRYWLDHSDRPTTTEWEAKSYTHQQVKPKAYKLRTRIKNKFSNLQVLEKRGGQWFEQKCVHESTSWRDRSSYEAVLIDLECAALFADESVENFTGTPPKPIAPPTFPEPEPEPDGPEPKQKIISFGWTKEELLAGKKTVTRRQWANTTLKQWQAAWDRGELEHKAYDKLPCYGGQQIGTIRLVERPYLERLSEMPPSEVAAEGFPELSKQEFIHKFFPEDRDYILTVVRFEFTPLCEPEPIAPPTFPEPNQEADTTGQLIADMPISSFSIAELKALLEGCAYALRYGGTLYNALDECGTANYEIFDSETLAELEHFEQSKHELTGLAVAASTQLHRLAHKSGPGFFPFPPSLCLARSCRLPRLRFPRSIHSSDKPEPMITLEMLQKSFPYLEEWELDLTDFESLTKSQRQIIFIEDGIIKFKNPHKIEFTWEWNPLWKYHLSFCSYDIEFGEIPTQEEWSQWRKNHPEKNPYRAKSA